MKTHGHVFPDEDGMVTRCGGPMICQQCAREKAQSDAMLFGTGWLRVDAAGTVHYQDCRTIAIITNMTRDEL